jgi:hypothetical protein
MRRLLFAVMTGGAVLLSACAAEPQPSAVEPAGTATAEPVFEGPSGLELESEEAARAALEAQRVAAEAAAAAKAEAQRQAQEAAAAEAARAAAAEAEAETASSADEECIGYGCSPEQDAELNEWERAANDDYGPGCNYQLCGEPGYEEPYVPTCDWGPDGVPICE